MIEEVVAEVVFHAAAHPVEELAHTETQDAREQGDGDHGGGEPPDDGSGFPRGEGVDGGAQQPGDEGGGGGGGDNEQEPGKEGRAVRCDVGKKSSERVR